MQKNIHSRIIFTTAAFFAAVLLCGADRLPEMARSGDIPSQLKLAAELFYGKNRPANMPMAFYWFRRAARQNSPEAQYNLAVMLEHGFGCEKNPAAACMLYETAMKNGIKAAALPYARMVFAGVPGGTWDDREIAGIKPDEKKALDILRTNAAADSPEVLLLMAKIMFANAAEHGSELRSLLKKYIDTQSDPDPEALLIYAACLRSGIGGHVPDPAAGAGILRRAAEKKHPEATAQLAEMFLFGFGVKQNRQEALKYYTLAMRYGSPRAMTDIAKMKLAGVNLSHDPQGAFELLKKAAGKNYPPAEKALGDCYLYGIGTEKDGIKALSFYQRAADSGDAGAMYQLGICFRDGLFTKTDPATAFFWFREAAINGHIQSMREAGKALLTGTGVQKDHDRALEILRRAAAAGDKEAAELLR